MYTVLCGKLMILLYQAYEVTHKLFKAFKYLNVFSCTYTYTSMFLINKNEILIKLKKFLGIILAIDSFLPGP